MRINEIYNDDALKGFEQMPDNFCDMIITSPPYYGLRDYGIKGQIGLEKTLESYLDRLISVFLEAKRVLKKEGTLWVNIGDSYGGSNMGYGQTQYSKGFQNVRRQAYYPTHNQKSVIRNMTKKSLLGIPFRFVLKMMDNGWILRNTIIWQKPNAMPESVKDRFTNDFEYLFFFTKSTKYHFIQQLEPMHSNEYDKKRMREGRKVYEGKWSKTHNMSKLNTQRSFVSGNLNGRNKRTVWAINTKPYNEAHFAVFPEALIEIPILAGSPENGIIIDPFMGSGTTGVVAKRFNRNYIGFEINPAFIKMANERISQTNRADKSVAGINQEDMAGLKKQSQYELNQEIEAFIDAKDFKNETYSKSDIAYIRKYDGAGGKAKFGARGNRLLYEFYTPDYIADFMYHLAVKYGYRSGHILEPSIATGNVIKPFVENHDFKSITAFEINPYTKRICEISFPKVKVYLNFFETAFLQPDRFVTKLSEKERTWLKHYPFDLVIGNPPYGAYRNKFSSYFKGKDKFKQVETFFIYKGLQLLKQGGLLIYITSSNFMRTGHTNWKEKERIGTIADFVDAYRLPKVFDYTDVPTDILIFRKK